MSFFSTISSAIGGVASALMGKKAAEAATQKQVNWERERATHAHQWEVEDLKAAGLNPILSANQGATTGGISAPVPDYSGINTGISNALTAWATAADNAKKGAEVQNIKQDTLNKAKQKELIESETILNSYRTGLIDKQTAEQELHNIMLQYRKDNYKTEFWVTQIEKAAKAAGLLLGGAGLSAAGIKKVLNAGKKQNLNYKNYDTGESNYISMPSL